MNDKIQNLLSQLESVSGKAKVENRSLNADELKKFDDIKADIDNAMATAKAEKTAAELRKSVENVVESRVLPALQDDVEARKFQQFRDYVFRGLEARDLQTSNGVFIPTTIESAILTALAPLPGIYAASDVKKIVGYAKFPAFVSNASAVWLPEGSTISAVDLDTGSIDLQPRALVALGKVSERLENATQPEIVAGFVETFANSIYIAREQALWNGTGSNCPVGITSATSSLDGAIASATVTMTTGSVVVTQLTNAIANVPANYRVGAKFYLSDGALMKFAGMVDGYGRPLNLVTFTGGKAYIMGYEVVQTPVSVATTAGTVVGVFGHPSQYRVGVFGNGAFTYRKLDQLFATSLSTGHLLTQYADAALGRKAAFVRILAGA
jgi:HK97 family phage major capsid protein